MTLNEVNKQTLEYCEAETQIEGRYSGLCVCVCVFRGALRICSGNICARF